MASNFECIGLHLPDEDALDGLLVQVLPSAALVASSASEELWRWQDPSGARLVLTVTGGRVVSVTPSFDARPGARLAGVWPLNDETVAANVIDEGGELQTRVALELEQHVLLEPGQEASGDAAVVAFGADVQVHESAEAFEGSTAAKLGGRPEVRMAIESVIPTGLFGDPAAARPMARLSGRVLAASSRINAMSGGAFVVARVQTVGMEVDVCLPGSDAPAIGGVVSGSVFLVGSMPALGRSGRDA